MHCAPLLRRLDARLGAWVEEIPQEATPTVLQEPFFLCGNGNVREAFFDQDGALNVILNFARYKCVFDTQSAPLLDSLRSAVCE